MYNTQFMEAWGKIIRFVIRSKKLKTKRTNFILLWKWVLPCRRNVSIRIPMPVFSFIPSVVEIILLDGTSQLALDALNKYNLDENVETKVSNKLYRFHRIYQEKKEFVPHITICFYIFQTRTRRVSISYFHSFCTRLHNFICKTHPDYDN